MLNRAFSFQLEKLIQVIHVLIEKLEITAK